MSDDRQLGVRIPILIYHKISDLAKEKEITFKSLVIEALIAYLQINGKMPGYCKVCEHLNPEDSKFCNQCGKELIK